MALRLVLCSVQFGSSHVGLCLTLTRLELIVLVSHFLGSTWVDDGDTDGIGAPYLSPYLASYISGYPSQTT